MDNIVLRDLRNIEYQRLVRVKGGMKKSIFSDVSILLSETVGKHF